MHARQLAYPVGRTAHHACHCINLFTEYERNFIDKDIAYHAPRSSGNAAHDDCHPEGIAQREALAHSHHRKQCQADSIEDEEPNFPVNCTNTLDWKFIASVKECIEKNMGDSDFNVEMLSNLHYMSRTSFFNKLKALTGYAPADYIRLIRLQHAAQLLKQGEYTITEIADKVGFSDAKYFREVFKKYYGVSPSKYVEAEKIHSQSSEQD